MAMAEGPGGMGWICEATIVANQCAGLLAHRGVKPAEFQLEQEGDLVLDLRLPTHRSLAPAGARGLAGVNGPHDAEVLCRGDRLARRYAHDA